MTGLCLHRGRKETRDFTLIYVKHSLSLLSTARPQKTTGVTFYGQGGPKHVEDVYQMRLLPGTDCETEHFWERACHENYIKFLPL